MVYDFFVVLTQCVFAGLILSLAAWLTGPRMVLVWAFIWFCASADILIHRLFPDFAKRHLRDFRWHWRWWMLPLLVTLVGAVLYGADCLLLYLDDLR